MDAVRRPGVQRVQCMPVCGKFDQPEALLPSDKQASSRFGTGQNDSDDLGQASIPLNATVEKLHAAETRLINNPEVKFPASDPVSVVDAFRAAMNAGPGSVRGKPEHLN